MISEMMKAILEQTRRQQEEAARENAAGAQKYGVIMHQDIPYIADDTEDHMLDVILPDDTGAVRPVILVIHGGGYYTCSKLTNLPQSAYLASCGWNAVNVNYRLQPEAGFREEIQDLCSALQWIGRNADTYGFDADHVMITGDSAGGHLALLLAAVLNDPYLQDYYGVLVNEVRVRAAAVSCPAGSLETFSRATDPVGTLCRTVLSFQLKEEDWDYVSIDRIIRRGTFPEVMILTTPTDDLLYKHTKCLHEAFLRAQVPHIYREFTGDAPLGHVFNVLEPQRAESIAANGEILDYFAIHIA